MVISVPSVIQRIKSPQVSFKGCDDRPRTYESIPTQLDKIYTTNKADTVTIWGASRESENIKKDLLLAEEISTASIERGKNVVTGAGDKGIMGHASRAAEAAYQKGIALGKKVGQSLAIIIPKWRDSDFSLYKAVLQVDTEPQRTQAFQEMSNTFNIFVGGATTIQESSTLIANKVINNVSEPLIEFMDKDVYEGLDQQYQTLERYGYLGTLKTTDLYNIVDSKEDYIKDLNKAEEQRKLTQTINSPRLDLADTSIEKLGNNTYIIKPGGVRTIQMAATLITEKKYSHGDEQPEIYFVNKDGYFNGLDKLYNKFSELGTLGAKPEELYKMVDSEAEIPSL